MCGTVKIVESAGYVELSFGNGRGGNLLDGRTIAEMTSALDSLACEERLRVLIVSSRGNSFCEGIDLNWMSAGARAPFEENVKGALKLTGLFKRLYDFPQPVMVRVQGDAIGAGVGLIAACDIAICANSARFSVREIRNGIIPAALSPYFIEAVGVRRARDYFLTARSFDAREAHLVGLVQHLCADEELEAVVEEVRNAILEGSHEATVATRELVRTVAHRPIEEPLVAETAYRIASFRATPLARQGIASALDGTVPPWKT